MADLFEARTVFVILLGEREYRKPLNDAEEPVLDRGDICVLAGELKLKLEGKLVDRSVSIRDRLRREFSKTTDITP